LRRRFGDDYVRLILFGSRARGDNAPDSDADVAIVFRHPVGDRWSLKRSIITETYPLLLETGLYVQPWPIAEHDLQYPDTAPNPPLLRNILREGVPA
jgi:antitoxin ChpS